MTFVRQRMKQVMAALSMEAPICHPERKRGTSPIVVDYTNRIGCHSVLVRSLLVSATRDDTQQERDLEFATRWHILFVALGQQVSNPLGPQLKIYVPPRDSSLDSRGIWKNRTCAARRPHTKRISPCGKN